MIAACVEWEKTPTHIRGSFGLSLYPNSCMIGATYVAHSHLRKSRYGLCFFPHSWGVFQDVRFCCFHPRASDDLNLGRLIALMVKVEVIIASLRISVMVTTAIGPSLAASLNSRFEGPSKKRWNSGCC